MSPRIQKGCGRPGGSGQAECLALGGGPGAPAAQRHWGGGGGQDGVHRAGEGRCGVSQLNLESKPGAISSSDISRHCSARLQSDRPEDQGWPPSAPGSPGWVARERAPPTATSTGQLRPRGPRRPGCRGPSASCGSRGPPGGAACATCALPASRARSSRCRLRSPPG